MRERLLHQRPGGPQRDDRARNTLLYIINSLLCIIIFRTKFSTAMTIFTAAALALLVLGSSLVVEQVQCAHLLAVKKSLNANHYPNHLKVKTRRQTSESVVDGVLPHCFPAVGFKMPKETPTSLNNWWCNTDTEYAFVGFSYDISECDFFFTGSMFFYMMVLTLDRDLLFQVRV